MIFKLKNRIFYLALAAIFTIGTIGINSRASALFGYDSGYDADYYSSSDSDSDTAPAVTEKLVVSKAPLLVNVLDKEGFTPLMRAVLDHNVEKVKKLLELGADLNMVPTELSGRYRNVLEFIYDVDVAVYEDDKALPLPCLTDKEKKDFEEIVDIILKHCVKSKQPLNVNSEMIRDQSNNVQVLWDSCGRWKYFDYMDVYPHLFTFNSELYFGTYLR